ncbi:MAG: single-stranded DNA-binding protein [Bacteroidetes bacterium]|nr:single-stranded DNA-binding protein [Bacteroidota bacterium]
MAGVNKVILVGNLGKDPEITNIGNDVKKAAFSLATSESYKTKDGNKVDQTEWHNIVLWRGLADIAERFLHKGSKIYLEGKIKYRTYDDKDGNKRYITEIVGDTFTMLDSKQGGQDGGSNTPPPVPIDIPNGPEDDLPF